MKITIELEPLPNEDSEGKEIEAKIRQVVEDYTGGAPTARVTVER